MEKKLDQKLNLNSFILTDEEVKNTEKERFASSLQSTVYKIKIEKGDEEKEYVLKEYSESAISKQKPEQTQFLKDSHARRETFKIIEKEHEINTPLHKFIFKNEAVNDTCSVSHLYDGDLLDFVRKNDITDEHLSNLFLSYMIFRDDDSNGNYNRSYDIKPQNIFYKKDKNGKINFVIADFYGERKKADKTFICTVPTTANYAVYLSSYVDDFYSFTISCMQSILIKIKYGEVWRKEAKHTIDLFNLVFDEEIKEKVKISPEWKEIDGQIIRETEISAPVALRSFESFKV